MPLKKDKRPILVSWKAFQSKAADENLITTWWEQYPDANIGIITGKISGITVVDIDTKGGKAVPLDTFPKTFTVRTPSGGYHLYYKYNPNISQTANTFPHLPHVDIRNDGGYVVAPPSDNGKGNSYEVVENLPLAEFPLKLFNAKKGSRKLHDVIGVKAGGRNDSIASFAGQLLRNAPEKEWGSEVWPAVQRANQTYSPPLPPGELKTTFDSIVKKEIARRAELISPIQMDDGEGRPVKIPIRKNSNGNPYKDMANALAVITHHPYFKGNIKYNLFKQEIEYKGVPIEDADFTKIQYFMQTTAGIPSIAKDAIFAAVQHYAMENQYDEAQDWMQSLKWDKKERLTTWIAQSTHVEDNEYHAAIGAQWIGGIVRRIMEPGCIFDYMLVLVGPQGIGKTSFFRIIGGPWYKSYVNSMDNKDFYLALRGALIMDLDEGATLNKSDSIKLKSIITSTHDEYRAPYERVVKKFPRRFVFSMSTNDTEPFRDATGNRRYWAVDGSEKIDFKWLENNRDQIFAEAYHYWKNKIPLPEVPEQEASDRQRSHLPEDSWTELVMNELQKYSEYCKGDPAFVVTLIEIYSKMFTQANMSLFGRQQEMRIASVFKNEAGLEKKRVMVMGDQKMRWVLTEKKAKELQEKNASDTRDDFDLYQSDTGV